MKKRKGKRKRVKDEEDNASPVVQEPHRQPLDPSILSNSILTSVLIPPDRNIDPTLLQQSIPITADSVLETPSLTPTLTSLMDETS